MIKLICATDYLCNWSMLQTGHTISEPDISCHIYLLFSFLNFSDQYLSRTKCHISIKFPNSKFFSYTLLKCTLGLFTLQTRQMMLLSIFCMLRLWLIQQTGKAVHLPAQTCIMATEMVKVDHWFHRFPVVKKQHRTKQD